MLKENHLAHETSPYLLQHKNNPVDWYPWGEEALQKAKQSNKPICLSIGYSSCHWCHVMAHESFEDEETARLMNELFINIKVDREERPDLDEIYIEAVQLMTQRGGWPLTVFLTPDLKPFFGGTYFPLEQKYGQPSFKEILRAVSSYFNERKDKILEYADQIIGQMKFQSMEYNLANLEVQLQDKELNSDKIAVILFSCFDKLLQELEYLADKKNGGFSGAPKFVQPSKVFAALASEKKSLQALAILTLNNIACGGITDHIDGGIARYAIDSTWTVPHFEKMLYDNA
ncbi:MAG: DUF255 domain-containing protein, partial [Silvanigrellaceae bacterium]|nr:DUF255 domain-containing protein [Silvanigrellaceae bacterium]